MHLLDAISFQQFLSPNYNYKVRAQAFTLSNKFVLGNAYKRWEFRRWSSFQAPKMDKVTKFGVAKLNNHSVFVIRVVATIETNCSSTQIGNNLELGNDLGSEIEYLSGEEPEELDEKEKLRRMRISKANKGNTPWNKGRKHTPETLRRIRERTRIAMQSPKVKMKLINLGHSQSKETRVKIGVGVRAGWERRREKLKLQETCYFEWQNLIAEASRTGFSGEIELQWDSYNVLDRELEKEWQQSVEQRKNTPRPKGNKRAPKSLEQRRKISEAISAKWADAGYRERVVSALSKYYGTSDGEGKKPRRKPGAERTTRVQTTTKKKAKDKAENENLSQKAPTRRRNSKPTFKDPLASSKLEMIKSIRTQRAMAELEKTQAFRQAKLLIWEAERAAKALEESATKSPLAQASLLESRELIAQAIESLNSIEKGLHMDGFYENEGNANDKGQINHEEGGVNGFESSKLEAEAALDSTSRFKVNGFSIDVEGGDDDENKDFATTYTEEQLFDQLLRLSGEINIRTQVIGSSSGEEEEGGDKRLYSKTSSKKWVHGKLVEITEETN